MRLDVSLIILYIVTCLGTCDAWRQWVNAPPVANIGFFDIRQPGWRVGVQPSRYPIVVRPSQQPSNYKLDVILEGRIPTGVVLVGSLDEALYGALYRDLTLSYCAVEG